ncbi:septation protein SepH, partial [Pseudokineococcus basanitobsidens]
MQDLTLVGVHDDGEHLVLAAPDGTRFRLLADDGLRLAARRTARAPGDPAGSTSPVTPREIQARLRAGEDAAEIAAASGSPEERVRRYEAPVLAERAHVADRARALPVRWRDGSGRSPALEDLVAERLTGRGVEAAPAWDAWRREDGAWLVQAVFRAGARERRATWALDLQRASLEALDDESRWLSSVDAGSGPPVPDAGPRLAPVREEVYDVDDAGARRRTGRDDGAPSAPVDLASRRAGGTGRRSGEQDRTDEQAEEGSEEGAEADRRERV